MNAPRCYLCERGGSPRGRRHTVRDSGAIAHFDCPTTRDQYDAGMVAAMSAIATFRALAKARTNPQN